MKKTAIGGFVPASATGYCEALQMQYPFDFLLSRPRRSRLGDFTVKPGVPPRITVNADLNPFNFLVTYLHEVAHCVVHYQFGKRGRKRPAPHGREWKQTFTALLQPVLNESVFPEDILQALVRYSKNPGATTSGNPALIQALRKYDVQQTPDPGKVALVQLHEGTSFVFQNRQFIRGSVRRTRVLCTDTISKRLYTIPAHALVEAC